jgi:hypothetical protein
MDSDIEHRLAEASRARRRRRALRIGVPFVLYSTANFLKLPFAVTIPLGMIWTAAFLYELFSD